MKGKAYRGISGYLLSIESISIIVIGCLMSILIAQHASGTTENTMKSASTLTIESSEIPSIDKNSPPTIQTASFGLG